MARDFPAAAAWGLRSAGDFVYFVEDCLTWTKRGIDPMKKDLFLVLAFVGGLLFLIVTGIGLLIALVYFALKPSAAPPAPPPAVTANQPARTEEAGPATSTTAGAEPASDDTLTATRVDAAAAMKEMVAVTEKKLEQAEELLRELDYAAGLKLQQEAMQVYRYPPARLRSKAMSQSIKGVRYVDWGRQREQEFEVLVNEHAQTLIDEFDTGKPDEAAALAFIKASRRFPGLRAAIRRLSELIGQLRAQRARHWLRVEIYGAEAEYHPILRQALAAKWPPTLRYKLNFEGSFNAAESRATWKLLRITIREKNATYKVAAGRNRLFHVPRALDIRFALSGSRAVPTNWDKLQPLWVEIEVPKTVDLKDQQALAQAIRYCRKQLREKLAAACRDLPTFAVFPDLDHDSLRLVGAEGKLDEQSANALFILAPERFHREFKPWLAKAAATDPERAASFIIANGLDQYVDWLAEQLVQGERGTRSRILRELQRHRTFNGRKPLLALLAVHDRGAVDAARLLQPQVATDKAVQAAMVRACRDGKHPYRKEIAAAFLVKLQPEDRLQYRDWILDADAQFSQTVYSVFANYHRDRQSEFILSYYSKVAGPTRQRMLERLTYRTGKVDPKVLELVKAAAGQQDDPAVQLAAIRCLRQSSSDPEAWAVALDVLESVPEKERLGFRQSLIYSVYRARPKTAEAWLLQVLRQEHEAAVKEDQVRTAEQPKYYKQTAARRIRQAALRQLFSAPEDRTPLLKQLPPLLSDSNDLQIRRDLITNLHRAASRRRLQFDQKEVPELLAKLVVSDQNYDRRRVYEVMARGFAKYPKLYRPSLEAALKTETDKTNQRILRRALGLE